MVRLCTRASRQTLALMAGDADRARAAGCLAGAPDYSHMYSMNDGPEMTLQESPAGLQA